MNNQTPPHSGTGTGTTRLDLAALTARADLAAPTQALPAPLARPVAGPVAEPVTLSGERERQRERARQLNEARERAERERLDVEATERAAAVVAAGRRRRHQRRMDLIAEVRAWGWTAFAWACFMVLITTGVFVCSIFMGWFTPWWMAR